MSPRSRKKDPGAVALGRKRIKKLSGPERKELASKGGSAAWAKLSPEERSAEMKRRAAKRKRRMPTKPKP